MPLSRNKGKAKALEYVTPPTTLSALESLPPELLFKICSDLFYSHSPYHHQDNSNPLLTITPLSQTSKRLQAIVESYSLTTLQILHTQLSIPVPKLPRNTKLKTYRGLLYRWMRRHCAFCGKKSVRMAILQNSVGCCESCDRKHFPKITLTNAKKEFHLTEGQLFCRGLVGTLKVRWGSYMTQGSRCTMFDLAQVERLADHVHGDWRGHMKERMEASQRRREAMVRNKDRKLLAKGVIVVHSSGESDDDEDAVHSYSHQGIV